MNNKPQRVTAYKDVNGNTHESKTDCEIANLKSELKFTDAEVEAPALQKLIEDGKKAARLLKLLTGK